MTYLSEPLQKLLSRQMAEAPTLEECRRCEPSGGISYHCCRTPGFALYENIELIYSEFVSRLWEVIPFGNKNLDINQFIQFYFTEVLFLSTVGEKNLSLTVYFPKILDYALLRDVNSSRTIQAGPRIVPDADLDLLVRFPDDLETFYTKRNYNRPTNQGCVFLERGEEPLIQNCKGCLLHTEALSTQLTRKPIDCLSFTCKLRESEEEKQRRIAAYFGELFLQFGT